MQQGYEFIEPEMGIRESSPNGIPSVAPPEGKFYLSRRLLALIIDGFVQNAVFLGISLGTTFITIFMLDWFGYPSSALLDDGGIWGFAGSIIAFSIVISLKIICEGLSGQTLGKKITGLKVVRADGTPCTLWAAAIRSLAIFIDLLVWGFVGLVKMRSNPWKQRFGDSWGKTVVLTTKQPDAQLASGRIPFIAAFFIALLFEGMFVSIILASQILLNPNWITS